MDGTRSTLDWPRSATARRELRRPPRRCEKNGSGRESGDEMSEDVSDGEGASADHQVGAVEQGADVPAKPARKKRNFKEDEYDRDDDFVDDSELMWEEHAAASRDGFFVYSGPLVREEEKPVASYIHPQFPFPCTKTDMLTSD